MWKLCISFHENGMFIYLVKTDEFEFATEVNSGWAYAEDALFLEPHLSIHHAHSHCPGESGRHHDSDDVQCPQHYPPEYNLQRETFLSVCSVEKLLISSTWTLLSC